MTIIEQAEAVYPLPTELQNAVRVALTHTRANQDKGQLGYAYVYLDNIPNAILQAADYKHTPQYAVGVQLEYILTNLSAWRGEQARLIKSVFKKYARAYARM